MSDAPPTLNYSQRDRPTSLVIEPAANAVVVRDPSRPKRPIVVPLVGALIAFHLVQFLSSSCFMPTRSRRTTTDLLTPTLAAVFAYFYLLKGLSLKDKARIVVGRRWILVHDSAAWLNRVEYRRDRWPTFDVRPDAWGGGSWTIASTDGSVERVLLSGYELAELNDAVEAITTFDRDDTGISGPSRPPLA